MGSPPDWEEERAWLYSQAQEQSRRERSREQGWVLAVLCAWVAGLLIGWLLLP